MKTKANIIPSTPTSRKVDKLAVALRAVASILKDIDEDKEGAGMYVVVAAAEEAFGSEKDARKKMNFISVSCREAGVELEGF